MVAWLFDAPVADARRPSASFPRTHLATHFHTPDPRQSNGARREFVNIGHRGASAHAPENTFAAYDLALAHGAHYIEIDVRSTLDEIPVVVHDPSVERTGWLDQGPGSGLVATKTLQELRELDAGRWFGRSSPEGQRAHPFSGLRIPTLDEVLGRYRHCLRFCIELKDPHEEATEREVLRLLRQHSLDGPKNGHWRVLLLSFERECLMRLRALHTSIPLVLLLPQGAVTRNRDELADLAGYTTAIAPHRAEVGRTLVTEAHERGLSVHPYTVNETSDMVRLLSAGVDGMITDFPDRLDALLWERFMIERATVDTS